MDIPLGSHLSTTIDYDDFAILSKYHWSARKSHSCWYAIRKETVRGQRRTVFMHRQITAATPDQEVHHKNFNTLDNRRANLELTTPRLHHLTHAELRLICQPPTKTGGTPQRQIQIH